MRVKIVVPPAQRGDKGAEVSDIRVGRLLQLADPFIERFGLIDAQRLVRAEGGKDGSGQVVGGDFFVVGEIIGWVIGGAESGDVEFAEDAAGGEFRVGEHLVGTAPDARGALFVEKLVDAEVAFQFEMGPVKERVAQGMGHRGGPGAEFVQRRGGAGAEFLGHAVGAHGAPFVMVASEPNLGEVVELAVLGDVADREVAMIIKDRLRRGILAVEPLRGAAVE